ncbi:MAG TPA: HD domain-containing protein [Solirubrobacterales bacterium]|nr:HD domain-containing protein [Solirubrobacterales bacterium]
MNLSEVASATMSVDLVGRVNTALDGASAWVVGGAVRDVALGREVSDLDLAVAESPRRSARAVADALGGFAFELSSEFPTWRARDRDGSWQVDLAELRGGDIGSDLSLRDFTVGAIAVDLVTGDGLDPTGGLGDIEAGIIRAAGPESFSQDPLRLMRAARLASQFGWRIDPGTVALGLKTAPRAAEPAGERILAELCQLMATEDPVIGLNAMDSLGLFESVLPEIGALKGVVQGPNHHLDVYGHTIEVLEGVLRIESDLEAFVGESAEAVRALLDTELADGISRSTGLRLGALFHDCAKPETRRDEDGFVTFRGHDAAGAAKIAAVFKRLRSSNRLSEYVAALARHHLILGFMVVDRPLSRRRIYGYLTRTDPVSVDVTLLTVADRLGARGAGSVASDEMIAGHLELASEMVADGLEWRRTGPPAQFLPGDELADRLGIEPGPDLGRIMDGLAEARYAGEIDSASEAVELARRLLDVD